MTVEEMKTAFRDFAEHIRKFNLGISSRFDFEGIPYHNQGRAFPKHGSFHFEDVEYQYRFHGSGVSILAGNIEIHYDVVSCGSENGSIKVSCWKFWRFLDTDPRYSSLGISEKDSDNILLALEKEGFLRLVPGTLGQFEYKDKQ